MTAQHQCELIVQCAT